MTTIACLALVCACSTQKPDPAPTQIVDGKSIIIPPEFDVVPEQK
jgi:hypothetical protein